MARDIAGGIRKIAADTEEAGSPFDMVLGDVLAVSPLQVRVDEKMVLGEAQLLLSTLVSDFEVDMTVSHRTEIDLPVIIGDKNLAHSHAYSGKKQFTVHLGLAVGERVLMLRCRGGQQYIVLDRMRGG